MKIRKISSKILLSQMVMIGLALAASSAAIYLFTSGFVTENARNTNRDTARLAENLIRRDMDQAALFSKLIAENYQLKVGLAALKDKPVEGAENMRLQLRAELNSVSADFLSVAGENGVVFAHESRGGEKPLDREVLNREPLFLSTAFQECTRTGKYAVDVEPVYPNTLAVVAVAPVEEQPGRITGYVRLGYRLDQRFVEQLKNVTKAHVAIQRHNVIIAGTLPRTLDADGKENQLTVKAIEKDYLVDVSPLRGSNKVVAELVTAYPLSSIGSVRRRSMAVIALVSTCAFLLFVPVSLQLARRVVQPMNALMSGVKRVEGGDLNTHITPLGSDEIYTLAESFNRMTDALRARDAEIRLNQDQLIESGKLAAIGELAAGVAHEIGNPLAAISGYIQLLKDSPTAPKSRHFLEEMEKEVGFIDSTIRELLNFSRPAKTEEDLVPLNSVVDECLRMLSFHKAARGTLVEKKFDENNPRVLGSRKELMQAALNLALNGLQAMPNGGKLTISVESGVASIPRGMAAISVRDTGEGIPPEAMGKIFDPFFTTKRAGTGLGLSITYRIVQRHQGEIKVDSSAGGGTTFIMLLPLYAEPQL